MKTLILIGIIGTLTAMLGDEIFQAFAIFAVVCFAVLVTALAFGRKK